MTKQASVKTVLDLSLEELQNLVKGFGAKPFVAKQIFEWVYKKKVIDFDEMSNLSKEHREKLKQLIPVVPFVNVEVLPSKDRLATKYIFELEGHQFIEAVVLVEKTYKTLCISSQSGCPVDCKFCLTGYAGFKKQLSLGEILGQLLYVMNDGHAITHLVYMGMGEPLLNVESVYASIERITAEDGFYISRRNITVSTAGYIQGIKYLMDQEIAINLAFSVGNPNPEKRIHLMPIEERNPINEVSRVLSQYLKQHNRKLTLEYTLLEGENDGDDELEELGNLAKYLNAKVNLINLNPHPKIPYKPVSSKALKTFKQRLAGRGVRVTIRYTKGQDIVAACGQLGESLLK